MQTIDSTVTRNGARPPALDLAALPRIKSRLDPRSA